MKNKAGIRAVTDIARFKLKESLAGVKVKVGFVGEPSSGKTSLIEAIFGKEVSKKSKEKDSVKYETYKFPGWKNIKFAEIPAVTSHRRLEREEYLEEMKIKGYDLIVIVTENHIREWAMWLARELKDLGKIIINENITTFCLSCHETFFSVLFVHLSLKTNFDFFFALFKLLY